MKTAALKVRPKAAFDTLWQLSILCQKLKNGDQNYPIIYDTEGDREGLAELWEAVQTEARKLNNRFPTTKTAYLEFIIELLRLKVPLYSVRHIQKVSENYRCHVPFTTQLGMISHYTEWEAVPKTEVAWDYFIHFVIIDNKRKEVSTCFYKNQILKLEEVAAALHFEMTVGHYQDGLYAAWKKNKFNQPLAFEKVLVGFKLEALNMANRLPNKAFFQELCMLMPLKNAFLLGLTDTTFSGLHGLFNRFWLREMPVVFEKMGKKMPDNIEKTNKPQIARFFELWLQSKYPKMFDRMMTAEKWAHSFTGKWSFRQVVQYLPPCVLAEWGNYAADTWQFAFMTHLGNGGSPRTFVLPPQYGLSKRAAYLFVTAEVGMDIADTLRFAMMTAFGASDALQMALRPYMTHFTASVFEECVRFLVRENVDWQTANFRILFNYVNHILEETGTFDFKGCTIASLYRAHDAWQREILLLRLKAQNEQKWTGAKFKDMDFKTQDGKTIHRFVQLKNALVLALEGEAMHHCVGCYVRQCIEGSTSIWSLRRVNKKQEVSIATVQVTGRQIVQARGLCNALPDENERLLIQKWSDTEGVEFLRC